MMRCLIIMLFTCAWVLTQAQVNIITTIAGKDTFGYGGDGGLATNAKLNAPYRIGLDKDGNVYISDVANHRIRKIDISTGIIKTIAGTGLAGYNGDGIPATDAQLNIPQGISLDTTGNIYIGDALNFRIRKINVLTGIISTVAGNGVQGTNGDGSPATAAELDGIVGINTDIYGNIFIVDYTNNKIRKINFSTGIIATIAGSGLAGYSGNGGQATNAKLHGAIDVCVDNNNDILISDKLNNVLRKVNTSSGIISTIAGSGIAGFDGDGGLAVDAKFNQQSGTFVDKNNDIYIADYENGSIRKISTTTGIINTVAGIGVKGFYGDGGPATNAKLAPTGICVDKYGNLIIADYENDRIRKVNNAVAIKGIDKEVEGKLYPNPTKGIFTIQTPIGISLVHIYNIAGMRVYERTCTTTETEIDITALPSGVYMVYVQCGEKQYVSKVVKE